MKHDMIEKLHRDYHQHFKVDKTYHHAMGKYQHIHIFDNPTFGRVLALDHIIQTTQLDEANYHEMFAHTPILSHGNVRDVLIIGGGDGGLLREVCQHESIEHITMVELDDEVVALCKAYMPMLSQGAFDDPRVDLVISDGHQWMIDHAHSYDVILCDSTDPIGPGAALFSDTFYRAASQALRSDGIMVAQSGVYGLQFKNGLENCQRLAAHLNDCCLYRIDVPSYAGGNMQLLWGSDQVMHRHIEISILNERFEQACLQTSFYNPQMHLAAFAIPNALKQQMHTDYL